MIDKTFDFSNEEPRLFEKTRPLSSFKRTGKPTFTMVLPPPNITGTLHMGHALNNTLQDVLARFKRLCGFDVLWQGGTDHAGIATQMVVERQLASEGLKRQDLGRDAFLKRVWDWKEHSGDTILRQQERLGLSMDWTRLRFTLDKGLSDAVIKVFVTLYEQKLIYRDKRLVNWDPKFQTAISDLEVVSTEKDIPFYHIFYPFVDTLEGSDIKGIVVATTRPETLFGDVAVAVHPDDERYAHLIGKKLRLPLSDREIPLIADTYSDPLKGTGAVKITPAHDFNDFEVGRRHHLSPLNILDAHAHLNDQVPLSYQGLSIREAREKIITDLGDQLIRTETIRSAIPYGDRSGEEIQPWLTDQWFVDVKGMADQALLAVERGETSFIPESWAKTYFEWLRQIQPWCISRQLWWGHQIPAWYGPEGTFFVAKDSMNAHEQARAHFGYDVTLTQDSDVLDTWFSSALWPFSTLGWPKDSKDIEDFYPTSVLVTGFDIIFFWVARMMMMGIHFLGKIPFKTVYVHALVRDEKGQKMSKSKGNSIDPLELIDAYGADALRFTLTTLAVPGRDVKLNTQSVETRRNFMTKIWNCARFLMLKGANREKASTFRQPSFLLNRWIVSKMATCAQNVRLHLENYRFDQASLEVYHFLWGDFCDTYVEALKPLLNTESAEESLVTASYVFREFLLVAHPFIPFVTEKLWETFGSKSCQESSWPSMTPEPVPEMDRLLTLVEEIRSFQGILGSQNQTLYVQEDWILEHKYWLQPLARVSNISTDQASGIPISMGDTLVFLEHSGDLTFLSKKRETLTQEKNHLEKKIGNLSYKEAKPEAWANDVALLEEKIVAMEKIRLAMDSVKTC